ncbi:ROK family protein [Pontibacter sp. 13R65]|uniref:ROK family protein n=1 Tax=Pontibacter sp. 13R65 TaxID=3127458 RepID=UPI00301C76DA
MGKQKLIGIDIGGTKMHIGVVQDECILDEIRLETSAHAPKEQILAELAENIEKLLDQDVASIGIGVPGLVDEPNGIVLNVQNIPSWREVHLKQFLESRLGKPVFITNDANSFVLGEKIYGKAKEFSNVVGITLGTGFGAGIILNNRLYTGTLSSAGEFGGIPYLDQTIEDYCSGKFFMKQYGIPGHKMQVLARNGDTKALEAFAQFGRHLGDAIKIILYAISPEAIFLGGSASSGYLYYKEAMHASIEQFPFKSITDRLVVAPSSLKNVAILGAAALCHMRQKNRSELQNV